jgi:outer membrane protein insertion porin family
MLSSPKEPALIPRQQSNTAGNNESKQKLIRDFRILRAFSVRSSCSALISGEAPMKQISPIKQILFWVVALYILEFLAVHTSAGEGNNTIAEEGLPAIISDIRIEILAPPYRRTKYNKLARRLINLKPGDALTDFSVQRSIEAIKRSHQFSAIQVDSDTTAAGEQLIFTLRAYRYIKDIRIDGNYPLFERDVLTQMNLFPGDPYTSRDLSYQMQAIVKRYKREGYIDPRVSWKALTEEDDDDVILVDIEKGPHYVLNTLNFVGNRAIGSASLKRRMQVWRNALLPDLGRFSEYHLKKDMDQLLKYYRKKGFAEAEISYQIEAPQGTGLSVTIRVREGPQYKVSFEDIRHL